MNCIHPYEPTMRGKFDIIPTRDIPNQKRLLEICCIQMFASPIGFPRNVKPILGLWPHNSDTNGSQNWRNCGSFCVCLMFSNLHGLLFVCFREPFDIYDHIRIYLLAGSQWSEYGININDAMIIHDLISFFPVHIHLGESNLCRVMRRLYFTSLMQNRHRMARDRIPGWGRVNGC